MLRVRKQDINGDMSFGHGDSDFLIDNSAAVGQLLLTRLLLWTNQWFLDLTQGTPYLERILGKSTASVRNAAIRDRILTTFGVLSISDFSATVNTQARHLEISAKVTTIFSFRKVNISINTISNLAVFTLDESPLDDTNIGLGR